MTSVDPKELRHAEGGIWQIVGHAAGIILGYLALDAIHGSFQGRETGNCAGTRGFARIGCGEGAGRRFESGEGRGLL